MGDPAAIARALSDAQREAVLRADDWRPAYALSENHDGYAASIACRTSGLFTRRMGGANCLHYHLNDLGLAVRSHLLNADAGGRG